MASHNTANSTTILSNTFLYKRESNYILVNITLYKQMITINKIYKKRNIFITSPSCINKLVSIRPLLLLI
jgi:hypothetical protein